MDPIRFDQIARTFATTGLSRRRLLHTFGGSLVGAALVSAGLRHSAAAQGSSDCARWCSANFPPGPERGACVSAATQGQGACYDCGGPMGPCQGGICVDGGCIYEGWCPTGSDICSGTRTSCLVDGEPGYCGTDYDGHTPVCVYDYLSPPACTQDSDCQSDNGPMVCAQSSSCYGGDPSSGWCVFGVRVPSTAP